MLEALYPWESYEKKKRKKNSKLATSLLILFSLVYSLTFIFQIIKIFLPSIIKVEKEQIGFNSRIILFFGELIEKNWKAFLFFLPIGLIYLFFSLLITETNFTYFKKSFHQIKNEISLYTTKEVLISFLKDSIILAIFGLVCFIFSEIITVGVSTILLSFILTIIFQASSSIYASGLLLAFLIHLIFSPIILFFYYRIVKIKKRKSNKQEYDKYYQDGKINLTKWKESTWDKKAYTYDWNEEKYSPFICPKCSSVISSNLTVCPICDADILELLDEIIEEKNDQTEEVDVNYETDNYEKNGEEDKT